MVATGTGPDLEGLAAWQAALAHRADQLRVQIVDKQNELTQIEERLSLVTRLLEVETRAHGNRPAATHDGQRSTGPEDSVVQATAAIPDLEDAVEQVLRSAGKPLHISTIRDALLEQGVPIPGRGDDANIIVRLRRLEERFTRTARGTYGLAEWSIPALKAKKRTKGRTAAR